MTKTPDTETFVAREGAAEEIGRLASRILELAPFAGLHVGIKIRPAPRAGASR